MMKSIRNVVHAVLVLVLSAATAHAASLTGTMLINPGHYNIDGRYAGGSYFAMGGNTPNANAAMLVPNSSPGGIVLGTYQNFVLDPDEPHLLNWNGTGGLPGTGYSGTPTTESNMLAPFGFFGTPTYVGTNPVGYQSGVSHPAPTADVDLGSCVGSTCSLSLQLNSWEVMWNGSAFEQGPRPDNTGPFVPAIGTYDLLTHAYSVTWISQIKGGPFNSVKGYWHLDGIVVPVPGAFWLLASGLVGLLGLARKNKLANA